MPVKLELSVFLMCFALVAAKELGASRNLCIQGKEHNRNIVFQFYQRAFGDLEFEDAAKRYLSPNYIQHNPTVGDGVPAFLDFTKKAFKGASKGRVDIRASASDKNLVWLHVRLVIQGTANAIVEIFRVECSKIVEHWDVIQAIGNGPYANSHPFF